MHESASAELWVNAVDPDIAPAAEFHTMEPWAKSKLETRKHGFTCDQPFCVPYIRLRIMECSSSVEVLITQSEIKP